LKKLAEQLAANVGPKDSSVCLPVGICLSVCFSVSCQL